MKLFRSHLLLVCLYYLNLYHNVEAVSATSSTTIMTVNSENDFCFHIHGVPKSGTTWLTALASECKKMYCKKLVTQYQSKCKVCEDASRKKHKIDYEFDYTKDRHIFIFRDTRDVLVSHYHWVTHGFKDISKFSHDSTYGVSSIISDQNKFIEIVRNLNKDKHKFLVIHYESLHDHPLVKSKVLSEFLGLKLTDEDINKAVDMTSFDAMRAKEAKGKLSLKVHPDSAEKLQEDKPPEELFGVMTRKGEVGGYIDEIDKDTLKYVEDKMKRELDHMLLKRYIPEAVPDSEYAKKKKSDHKSKISSS